MLLSKEEVAQIFWKARQDPTDLIEELLWIRNKAGDLVRLKLNEPQRKVLKQIVEALASGRPARFIILKARQEGMSTLIEALIFVLSLIYPNRRGLVLTHERELSQELLGMSTLFYEQMDPRLRPSGPEPTLNRIRLDKIECSDGVLPIRSRITVDTSTGKESGRGRTYNFLHLSEFAFYPDPARTMAALLPAVPKAPGTLVVIESTANGIDNAFYARWQQAERGEGSFIPIFLPWFALSDYQTEPPPDFKPTPDEADLARTHGLTDAQLYWRRVVIADEMEGDEEKFAQEYPSTAEEAFLHSGTPAFSKKVLLEVKAVAEALKFRVGYLEPGNPPRFREADNGKLKVWVPPIVGREYIAGGDTAEGIETGDASAVPVLDRKTNRFVAEWYGKIDPRRLAHEMALIGRYYNTAILAPETNNTGLSTLIELHEHLMYPAIYRWRRYDTMRNVWTDKLGWQTTRWSRPLLVDDMTMALNDHMVGIVSLQMVRELMIFDAGPVRVADDDLAMAALITWHCHLVTPMADGTTPRALIEASKAVAAPKLGAVATSAWDSMDRIRRQLAAPAETAGRMVTELSDVAMSYDDLSRAPEIDW